MSEVKEDQVNVDVAAATSAAAEHNRAHADFSAAKNATWARYVLKHIWGKVPAPLAAETLTNAADELLKAMDRFEETTNQACGYSSSLMAAAISRYYGPDYILGSGWVNCIRPMAKAEAKLDEALGWKDLMELHQRTLEEGAV